MGLEIVILSKESQRKTNIMIFLGKGKKKVQMKLQNRNRVTDNKLRVTRN